MRTIELRPGFVIKFLGTPWRVTEESGFRKTVLVSYYAPGSGFEGGKYITNADEINAEVLSIGVDRGGNHVFVDDVLRRESDGQKFIVTGFSGIDTYQPRLELDTIDGERVELDINRLTLKRVGTSIRKYCERMLVPFSTDEDIVRMSAIHQRDYGFDLEV